MKRIFFPMLAVLAVVAVIWPAGRADAEIKLEFVASQDTTISLTSGYYQTGPYLVEFAANGTAALEFLWFGSETRSTVVRSITYYLDSDFGPRAFSFNGGPDSLVVDTTTASKVIGSASW